MHYVKIVVCLDDTNGFTPYKQIAPKRGGCLPGENIFERVVCVELSGPGSLKIPAKKPCV